MKLYHFTGVEYLDAIMSDGLSIGDVPTSARKGKNGVWFTTDPDPSGHGLSDGTEISPFGGRFANKRAVRITVNIPSHDRHLVNWMRWGRKHCDSWLFEGLNRAGHGKCKTWLVYFGSIPSSRFLDVEFLGADPPVVVVATLPDESERVVYGMGVVKAITMTGRSVEITRTLQPVATADEAAALEVAMRTTTINPFVDAPDVGVDRPQEPDVDHGALSQSYRGTSS
jgi:hypothetical protein